MVYPQGDGSENWLVLDGHLRLLALKQLGKTTAHAELREITLNHDLRTQVYKAVSEMSLTDGLDLVNQVFGMAGLGK